MKFNFLRRSRRTGLKRVTPYIVDIVDRDPLTIMLQFMRDEKGNANKIRTVPFIPGMVIERMGKRYQVDANGQQRRLHER